MFCLCNASRLESTTLTRKACGARAAVIFALPHLLTQCGAVLTAGQGPRRRKAEQPISYPKKGKCSKFRKGKASKRQPLPQAAESFRERGHGNAALGHELEDCDRGNLDQWTPMRPSSSAESYKAARLLGVNEGTRGR